MLTRLLILCASLFSNNLFASPLPGDHSAEGRGLVFLPKPNFLVGLDNNFDAAFATALRDCKKIERHEPTTNCNNIVSKCVIEESDKNNLIDKRFHEGFPDEKSCQSALSKVIASAGQESKAKNIAITQYRISKAAVVNSSICNCAGGSAHIEKECSGENPDCPCLAYDSTKIICHPHEGKYYIVRGDLNFSKAATSPNSFFRASCKLQCSNNQY